MKRITHYMYNQKQKCCLWIVLWNQQWCWRAREVVFSFSSRPPWVRVSIPPLSWKHPDPRRRNSKLNSSFGLIYFSHSALPSFPPGDWLVSPVDHLCDIKWFSYGETVKTVMLPGDPLLLCSQLPSPPRFTIVTIYNWQCYNPKILPEKHQQYQ